MSIFEQATRLRLRFQTEKGQLTVEDLWHLPLTAKNGVANLDDIARDLHGQLNDGKANWSLVNPDKKTDTALELKFEIVKHIVTTRLAEQKEKADERDRAERKQRIAEILAKREVAKLEEATEEELRKELAKL